MRAQSGYYPDLIAEAAAPLESLSQNHPFVDGNKRTAIASTAAFLEINGYRLQLEQLEAYRFMMDCMNRDFSAWCSWRTGYERTQYHSNKPSRIKPILNFARQCYGMENRTPLHHQS